MASGSASRPACPGEQGVDPAAQPRPIGRRQVEMAVEVEQGDLTDLLTGALRGDEAEGDVAQV
jgi:hypothetical protein